MSSEEVWFSHREYKYEVKEKWLILGKKFLLTDKKQTWDWDSCTVGIARALDNRLIVVVRSKTNKNSSYMGDKPVELRYMLGFEVTGISEPETEAYTARENRPERREGPKQRWFFQIKGTAPDDDYWIWEWAKEGGDINTSNIYRLYKLISAELSSSSKKSDNIFDVEVGSPGDEIIPVIYQPAVDSLKNFLREVHCAKTPMTNGDSEIEVTMIFENEQLRTHSLWGVINKVYETYRRFRYGRVRDVESFKILIRKNVENNKLIFKNIYSDNHQLEDDSIHGDKENAPERIIKYYFINHSHPVIFINTSNHAMAEHDANHRLWKWEYIPWMKDAPVKFENKTREEIDKEFKPILKFR